MTEVPKIVYDRLRAAERAVPAREATEQAHPDADLLTAFAERTLSPIECNHVLEHLALCGDCREVIALALPASEIASETEAVRAISLPAKAAKGWRAALTVPSMPWVALAACAAVVAAVLLVRPGKLNQPTPSPTGSPVASTAPALSLSASQPTPSASQMAASPAAESPAMTMAKTEETPPTAQTRPSKKRKSERVVRSPQAESGMMVARNSGDAQAGKFRAAPSNALPNNQQSTESVKVPEATIASTTTEVASGPSTDVLMARNEAPVIEKAKPALLGSQLPRSEAQNPQNQRSEAQESAVPGARTSNLPAMQTAVSPTTARSQDSSSPNPGAMPAAKQALPASQPSAQLALPRHEVIWKLAAGTLQRSLDNGQNWQSSVRADHALLCYASKDKDNDVWTGGQAGTLFHSADGGVTWVQVQPSLKTQRLSSDITRIDLKTDLNNRAGIAIVTSNNGTWSSWDGGKTWEKN